MHGSAVPFFLSLLSCFFQMVFKPNFVFILLGAILCMAGSGRAQNTKDEILIYEPTGTRVPSDYAPQGINFRGLVLYPELKVQPYYNDNIFSSETDEKADFVTNFIPRLKVEKKYGPHAFDLDLSGFASRHREYEDENLKLYSAGTSGNIHISEGLSALYSLYTKRDAISRQEPGDTQFTIEPVTSDQSEASLGLSKQFNRLTLTLLGKGKRRTYTDGTSSITGLPVIFHDGDHNTMRTELVASYDFLGANTEIPEHTLFALLSYQKQKFDETGTPPSGSNPNNKETGFLAGFTTKYKGLIFGKLGLGYFQRDFEAGEDVGKMDVDMNIGFNLTPKLTLSLAAGRDVDQDNGLLTGLVNTQGSLGLDYELLHNWYMGTSYTYKDKDFLGDMEGRNDTVQESTVYTRYLHSPRFESRLEFSHNARSSNASGADYDQNIIMYTLTGRF